VAGDLDLLAGGGLVEEAENVRLRGGSSHLSSHTAIIMASSGRYFPVISLLRGPGIKFSPSGVEKEA
jgi:hypothetical protein